MHSALYRYYADNCISGIHCVFTMATVIHYPLYSNSIPSKHNVMGPNDIVHHQSPNNTNNLFM